MDKRAATSILLKKLEEWESEPKSDGYEYGKSFLSGVQDLNKELFQLGTGELAKDRNNKKIHTQLEEITTSKSHVLCPKGKFQQIVTNG